MVSKVGGYSSITPLINSIGFSSSVGSTDLGRRGGSNCRSKNLKGTGAEAKLLMLLKMEVED